MNKVITINLNGLAYQLEESGYEALRSYLDNAVRRLEGNPDKDEIIADIERAVLGVNKTVVITKEVTAVIAEMGPVQNATDPAAEPAPGATRAAAAAGATGPHAADPEDDPRRFRRRLYKISEGAKLAGVCNGLAVYLDIDVTIMRVAFAFLTFMWGSGLLLYLLMAFILPEANTPAEKAAAFGGPSTAEEFIRRAKAGYYEGVKTFRDKDAHREWKRKFKQEMRGWKYNFHREMHATKQQWGEYSRFPLGAAIVWPVSILIQLVIFAVAVFAVLSLVSNGSAFGVVVPAGIPVWIGVIFLIVIYQCLTLPLRGWRHACVCASGRGYGCRYQGGFFDAVVWIAFLVAGVWLADHYVPQVHEYLLNLPPVIHRMVDSVQAWWNRQ